MDDAKLSELFGHFLKWYENDPHKQNEDFYKNTINYQYINSLTKDQFIDFFINFVNEGGKIQSGGHRKIGDFKKTISEKYKEFRSFVLQPFSQSFNLEEWLTALSGFNGFGQGSATIYLNRIDKFTYSVVNDKTIKFFEEKLATKLPSSLFKKYSLINSIQKDWITSHPEVKNLYIADSLGHYVIGTEDGGEIFKNILSDNLKADITNYWIFHCNPDYWDSKKEVRQYSTGKFRINKKYENEVKPGDKFGLWISGNYAGIYSFGEVTSFPSIMKDDSERIKDCAVKPEDFTEGTLSVELKYTDRFPDIPLLRNEVLNNTILKDLRVFNNPQGLTSVPLTEDQYNELVSLRKNYEKYLRILNRVNSIIPDKELQIKILKCFAESIIKANDSDPSGWNVRLHPGEFYLNTGQPWCICIKKNEPSTLVLDKPSLDKSIFGKIDRYQKEWDVPSVPPRENNYTLALKIEELPEIFNLTRLAHFKFIERAAKPHKARENHDADFVAYIGKVLGITLPIPSYFGKVPMEAAMINHNFNSKRFLNTILYGPPGTGKTYNTINKAVSIIDDIEENKLKEHFENREELKERFNELFIDDWENPKGQIGFITFHQSMSYEDFIEGIKPELDRSDGVLSYEIIPGIFKKMVELADKNYRNSRKSKDLLAKERTARELMLEFAESVKTSMGESDDGIFRINSATHVMEVEKDAFRYTGENWSRHEKGIRMKFNDLIEFYNNNIKERKDIRELSNINSLAKQHATYYFLMYQKLKEYEKENPVELHTEIEEKEKPYVLIIDEINRGNVSQIFGELITLIEQDKRAGSQEALEVTLPYSQNPFIIPPNLYIIGTMNTADRSVEALDTALRRRFSFEFMPPKYDLPELNHNIKGIEIASLLKTINKRITYLLDEDHQIGHSYFMSIADDDPDEAEFILHGIFRNKVIPLLKEYFYNDYGKIQLVLGKGFVETVKKAPYFAESDIDILEKDQYRITIDDIDFSISTALNGTMNKNTVN